MNAMPLIRKTLMLMSSIELKLKISTFLVFLQNLNSPIVRFTIRSLGIEFIKNLESYQLVKRLPSLTLKLRSITTRYIIVTMPLS